MRHCTFSRDIDNGRREPEESFIELWFLLMPAAVGGSILERALQLHSSAKNPMFLSSILYCNSLSDISHILQPLIESVDREVMCARRENNKDSCIFRQEEMMRMDDP